MQDLIRLHLGCGGNILPGWQNYDADVDITKPLPFTDNHADAIFIEHCVEHVTSPDAMRFFEECLRVLKPGGVLRVSVPSTTKIMNYGTQAYADFCHQKGFTAYPTIRAAARAIVYHHGHMSAWTEDLLYAFLWAAGFGGVIASAVDGSWDKRMETAGNKSPNSHWKVIGREFNDLETITCEATK